MITLNLLHEFQFLLSLFPVELRLAQTDVITVPSTTQKFLQDTDFSLHVTSCDKQPITHLYKIIRVFHLHYTLIR